MARTHPFCATFTCKRNNFCFFFFLICFSLKNGRRLEIARLSVSAVRAGDCLDRLRSCGTGSFFNRCHVESGRHRSALRRHRLSIEQHRSSPSRAAHAVSHRERFRNVRTFACWVGKLENRRGFDTCVVVCRARTSKPHQFTTQLR